MQEEKVANENALSDANVKFKSMEEELNALQQVMQKTRVRYEDAANEIRDLQKEHQDEKEDILGELR